jgi:hypothetical protein
MSDGLIIEPLQFCKLSQKQQLTILYNNQVETLALIRGYRFYQKLSATIGAFLVAGMGYLFSLHLK